MTREQAPRFVAMVPAAGRGQRFGADIPKQYMTVAGMPLIAHTLRALLAAGWMDSVHVVVSPGDTVPDSDPSLAALRRQHGARLCWHAVGGATRQQSVVAGLEQLGDSAGNTWVMVHDAARPGLSLLQLESLRDAILAGAPGALLAVPVADTVKKQSSAIGAPVVSHTVPRDGLWLAQTPQVFRLDQLKRALGEAEVTDEASAMELAGVKPALLPGSWRNMKVTTRADMELVMLALQQITCHREDRSDD